MGGSPQGRLFRLFFSPPLYAPCTNLAEELNPISRTPLCSFGVSLPWFLWLCAAFVFQLLCWCILRVTFAPLVFSSAPSRISLWVLGALLIATKDLLCCLWLFSYKYTRWTSSASPDSALLLLAFWYFCLSALLCSLKCMQIFDKRFEY